MVSAPVLLDEGPEPVPQPRLDRPGLVADHLLTDVDHPSGVARPSGATASGPTRTSRTEATTPLRCLPISSRSPEINTTTNMKGAAATPLTSALMTSRWIALEKKWVSTTPSPVPSATRP